MGRHRLKDDFRSSRLEQWSNIIRFLRKDQSRLLQYGKKVVPGTFLEYALIAVDIWSGNILTADTEELEKMELLTPQKGKYILNSRWYNQIVRNRPRIPRTHSKAGTNRKEHRFQQRTSSRTGRASADGNHR